MASCAILIFDFTGENEMADSGAAKIVTPRKRVAKGPRRPQYLQTVEQDKFMFMLGALLSEVSAIRDRLDTHEALAGLGRPITAAEVEAYQITDERQQARSAERDAMLRRVFRVLLEELEEARESLSSKELEAVLAEDTGD
jgi:hypothetical protein